MKNWTLSLVLLVLSFGTVPMAMAQSMTVKIKEEKALRGSNEFVITWEGESHAQTYVEVKAILDAEPMVERHVHLVQLERISAIVKEPWHFEQLKALFESHGFVVVNKGQPTAVAADHH